MRESNFSFPAQNRACVCISSQLYDRRALDTTSPLPLLNSLTHLTYLTSTSPRIREILTCDGGLERLVRILRDFCLSPPPPENPSLIYGLSPPSLPRPPPPPTLNPKSFDRHAAYRFSLAFQCVVNIGVRGSEPIRSRVVQAGTLDVVGCVLEAWLASKGFAVGPSASTSAVTRESREQRLLKRQLQREQAQELARLLARQQQRPRDRNVNYDDDDMMDMVDMSHDGQDTSVANSDAENSASTDNSVSVTPLGSGTPTGHVVVPGRDRSGTVVGRPIWDVRPNGEQRSGSGYIVQNAPRGSVRGHGHGGSGSTSASRPETETEDDGDGDADGDGEQDGDIDMMQDMDEGRDENLNMNMAPLRPRTRRAVGIVSDSPPPTAVTDGPSDSLDIDSHIIINTNTTDMGVGMGGVEDGIVALDQNVNDDLAMGAPPGAPGAIDGTPRVRQNTITLMPLDGRGGGMGTVREDMTPRAVLANLPIAPLATLANPLNRAGATQGNTGTLQHVLRNIHLNGDVTAGTGAATNAVFGRDVQMQNQQALAGAARHHHHHHRHNHHIHSPEDSGPFREEDVLLSLQLLAYLSKYPHVRQAFYKPRVSFHPASAQVAPVDNAPSTSSSTSRQAVPSASESNKTGFFKSLTGRGKEKAPANANLSSSASGSVAQQAPRMTNVFSLVERFTFRPSATESLSGPPPFLPPEIQYWAGVIMRNACRKDDSRGGIRQCANMLCGKWETFPREFAKCRRCRKAKYCGKDCQSKAWSEGHRFWCSAREGDDNDHHKGQAQTHAGAGDGSGSSMARSGTGSGTGANAAAASAIGNSQGSTERRQERERERSRRTAEVGPSVASMNAMLFSIAQGRRQASSSNSGSRRVEGAGRAEVARTDTVRPNRAGQGAYGGQSSATDLRLDSGVGADASDAAYSIASGSSSASSSTANSGNLPMDVIYSTGHRRRTDTVMPSSMASDSNPELAQAFIPYGAGATMRTGADYIDPFVAEGQNDEEDRIILDAADLNDMVSMRDTSNDDMILG